MNRPFPRIVVLVAILGLLLTPASSSAQPADTRPVVVSTHSIVGDLVQNVGRDRINLVTIVGPNGDVHEYEPVFSDVRAISLSKLVFENGWGMEPWLDGIYRASGSSSPRVWVSANITPRRNEENGEIDPHFWFDVQNVISSVSVIRDWLTIVDPANAAYYAANADAYVAELQALDGWVVERVSALAPERRRLVTSHDTFGYFAQRYGFHVLGSALASFSTEAEPSPQQIANLVREIRASGVPAIFAENVANPVLMERIARDAGVVLAPPLFTDALGPPNSPGNTYLNLMRYDVETIVTYLAR